jgi:hypothetical protein
MKSKHGQAKFIRQFLFTICPMAPMGGIEAASSEGGPEKVAFF